MDTRDNLREQAYKQSISTLTTNYESKIVDLRVELTLTSQRLQEVIAESEQKDAEIERLKDELAKTSQDEPTAEPLDSTD